MLTKSPRYLKSNTNNVVLVILEASNDHEGAWVPATKIARTSINRVHSVVQRSHFELRMVL